MLIEIQNLEKIYDSTSIKVPALKGINLKIHTNEFVSIMGPSGSGKSTLMNILGCLDVPSSGNYFFDGVNVSNYNDDALSSIRNKKIGFIFQTFNLLPRGTALHNVELPLIYAGINKHNRRQMALEVLDRMGLSERANHKPNELSGGQRQRVAIARAMVNKPEILLADEPTGNLDSNTSKEIMSIINELHKEGNTIILITHEDDIANNSQRIIYLLDGLIPSDKTITEFNAK